VSVKAIEIYIEGGGDSKHLWRELRLGFDVLFKTQKMAATAKGLGWKLSLGGGRSETCKDFIQAFQQADKHSLVVLLVDSDSPLPLEDDENDDSAARKNALRQSYPKFEWKSIAQENIHLMVQCMEAWIVADPDALASFYGNNFHSNKLPTRRNLEEEPKTSIFDKLDQAVRNTQKGKYKKIEHARKLLAMIDAAKVATRCPRFKTFTTWLAAQIEAC
jgi:hypothetical protein